MDPISRTDTTRLIELEMEHAGQITAGERNDMHWHAGAESTMHALARMKHDEHGVVEDGAKEVPKTTAKSLVKSAIVEGSLPFEARKPASEVLRALPKEVGKDLVDVSDIAIAQGVDCGKMYYDAIQDAHELHTRANEEAVDVVALSLLDLDPAFKKEQLAKHEGIVATKTMTLLKDNYGGLTRNGRALADKLQDVADAGAREAINALPYGREAYLKAHPDTAQRLKVDVAFNLGFENALSVAKDPKALFTLKQTIDARNPWTIADLQVRG